MKQNELIEALQMAIAQFGISILTDSKLVNILMDLGGFKTEPYARPVIRELIAEGYTGKIIRDGRDEEKMKSLVCTIANMSGITLQIAEYIVNSIRYALGYISKLPLYTHQSLAGTETKSTLSANEWLEGEYREKLPTGGELVISAKNWKISYYFPGPDARYNGTFTTIYSSEIDDYISAWRNNFKKYKDLKDILPSGGNSDYPGEKGMSIRFGLCEGVCLITYHMPIRNKADLDAVIQDYEDAKVKASNIQKIMRGTDASW